MFDIKVNLANSGNYGGTRQLSNIKYIVIHYTANDGDTDENNGKYFANNVVTASAHYFVDSDSITQSVPDNCTAYAVGGSRYSNYQTTGGASYYKKCTNANSLSIELCDDVKNGVVYPSQKTIDNALELTRMLMAKYNIPAANVIRHFDVTGKICPAYWAGKANAAKWKAEFWNKLSDASEPIASQTKTANVLPYLVRITADKLNVRADAGAHYKINTTVTKGGVYTIVEEKNGWGKLKSGAGWISLYYTKKL